jgi:hypothetical protein
MEYRAIQQFRGLVSGVVFGRGNLSFLYGFNAKTR